MSRITIAGERDALADQLTASLALERRIDCLELAEGLDAAVYLPARAGPDLAAALAFCDRLTGAGIRRLVLVSSAMVNEPSHRHSGHLSEGRLRKAPENLIARLWLALEEDVRGALAGTATTLTILRPAAVPVAGGTDIFSRLFARRFAWTRFAWTMPGFDPSLQLLSPEDLAGAIACAVEKNRAGVYNVAPSGVVPLRQALRRSRVRRLPVPGWLQRLGRKLARRAPADELEYLRYPWTVSGDKIQRELGFTPRHKVEPFDDFGMDRGYIAGLSRSLFRFLHDFYWRVEWRGLEHVPEGKVVLAGVHRGMQPWDGVMTLHLLARELGRYPRFLIHPALVKFPFLAPYMTKCGGIHACRENADWVLSRGEPLAIFPEGIRGAFSYYRDAYKLGRFGRDEFVKIALRQGAPIVPFVTVGSAEIFPIYAKFQWRWWKRYSEWPCFPITPTLSLLPLPSKWHTCFLAPVPVEQYGPEAADDPAVVRNLSQQVRIRMEEAIAEMLRRRKSIFYGSIFEDRDQYIEPVLDKRTA